METQDIITLIGATYTIASIVIRLTPTTKDDEVLSKVAPWHEKMLYIVDKLLTASRKK